MTTLGKQKILKQINRKHILNMLREYDEISIAELSKKANLSKPTVMKIMKHYIDKGFVVISGKGSSTDEGGKKPNIFKFNANGGYSIGMVITANKLKTIITNLKAEIIKSISVDLDLNEGLESVIEKISDLYHKLLKDSNISSSKLLGLAIGIYGLTDFDNGIVAYAPHYPSWGKNIKMRDRIKKKIADNIPIVLDNISRFHVFAEKTLGSAKNASNIISIVAGYGLSSGVIIENDIKRGYHKIMGEVGHMVINPSESMLCACGSRGCFEVMVSIARLKKIIADKSRDYPDSVFYNASNNGSLANLAPEEIFKAYNAGDKLASLAMVDIINWLAIGLANIMLIYDPQVIVLHGAYTRAGDHFLKMIRKKVEQISLTSVKKDTKINFSELGDMAGVLGAAAFLINRFFQ
ncbi:MAG: ROK family transcriptional regulator [Actinobacteria bacterium]|nr:ROK family transcriptional regulator [Actinomycetota bacterium]